MCINSAPRRHVPVRASLAPARQSCRCDVRFVTAATRLSGCLESRASARFATKPWLPCAARPPSAQMSRAPAARSPTPRAAAVHAAAAIAARRPRAAPRCAPRARGCVAERAVAACGGAPRSRPAGSPPERLSATLRARANPASSRSDSSASSCAPPRRACEAAVAAPVRRSRGLGCDRAPSRETMTTCAPPTAVRPRRRDLRAPTSAAPSIALSSANHRRFGNRRAQRLVVRVRVGARNPARARRARPPTQPFARRTRHPSGGRRAVGAAPQRAERAPPDLRAEAQSRLVDGVLGPWRRARARGAAAGGPATARAATPSRPAPTTMLPSVAMAVGARRPRRRRGPRGSRARARRALPRSRATVRLCTASSASAPVAERAARVIPARCAARRRA